MPLSTIIGIKNTMKLFLIGYFYITSESAEAFTFIHSSLQDMVFYDCPGPSIVLGDFSAGLFASMKEVQRISAEEYAIHAEGVMDRAIGIVAQVQDHEVFSASGLQLCEWHAAEAIKKRLVNEGYDARLTAI